ncbi:hypothetical protein SAMN05444165_0450 [Paraburkholderia phenazinium]|jgi:hypothetical protein|uniref:Uncharacterized protein n=1 Tax=Paraburkholderia phenazinium TaxID=60549 RepID=A0A1N6FXN6_9BURK|nr:hypothetical protein SAMN05444165_0450 [Paraburkholderia phenazinium]
MVWILWICRGVAAFIGGRRQYGLLNGRLAAILVRVKAHS